jgi:hypothetical protein
LQPFTPGDNLPEADDHKRQLSTISALALLSLRAKPLR